MRFTILTLLNVGRLLADPLARLGSPMIRLLVPLALASLAACGGGGGSATTTPTAPIPPTTPVSPTGIPYTAGLFQPASSFAAQCQAPRTALNPDTGRPWPDRQGSLAAENHWLRSWTHDLYLWFDEVPDRDPSTTATTLAYFALQKTTQTLASGQSKDRFHFTAETTAYRLQSESGVEVGYGAQWAVQASTPPRRILVAYTEPGSPLALATPAVGRGAEVLGVDGIDVVNDNTSAGVNTINAGLSPTAAGQTHTLLVRDRGATATRSVTLQSTNITNTPVQNARVLNTGVGRVGYLLFNDHIATAERGLIDAVNVLKTGQAQDLVLDLRYNGGGYLDIASELAYMIAGPARTAGFTFERLQFNSKHPSTDPVTGVPLAPEPFLSTTQGFSVTAGLALPTLNLARVYVLTSASTCSASESIINSLRGIGVEVVQVGANTCGKPYGFYPTDNCGMTYFSIQFRGVNNAGFGDYPEGFSATRSTGAAQANLPGCAAPDDFAHDLGDANEGQLKVALNYRAAGTCLAATAPATGALAAGPEGLPVWLPRTPWRENRVLR